MLHAHFLRICLLTLLLTAVCAAGLRAQANASTDGRGRSDAALVEEPVILGPVTLGPEWLFHPGDDPARALLTLARAAAEVAHA